MGVALEKKISGEGVDTFFERMLPPANSGVFFAFIIIYAAGIVMAILVFLRCLTLSEFFF